MTSNDNQNEKLTEKMSGMTDQIKDLKEQLVTAKKERYV